MRYRPLLLLSLLALAVLPGVPTSDVAPSAAGNSAMRAFVDPETGRLTAPTRQQRASLSSQRFREIQRRIPARVETHRGMTFVHLPPDRDVHLYAETGGDGQVRMRHGAPDHD